MTVLYCVALHNTELIEFGVIVDQRRANNFSFSYEADSTYSRAEAADFQHPKDSLDCYSPKSSHWRSEDLGTPNECYETVTGFSP